MDSDRPNRSEGSNDQPTGAYPPPPPPPPVSRTYSQPQSTQPYGAQQGDYSQGQQYSDRPASQPAQPQYGSQPASPQQPTQGGGNYPPQYSDQSPQAQYPPQGQYNQQGQYPPQQQQPYYNQPSPPPNQVNVAPKKSNNGMMYGLLGLLLVVVAAAAVWYFAFNKNGVNPLNPIASNTMSARESTAASAFPSNSLGYVSIATNVEGSQKAAFDKLNEAFQSQPGFKDMVDSAMKSATGSAGGQVNEMGQEIQGLITKYTKQISIGILPPSTTDWAAMQSGGQAAMVDVATRNIAAVADMDLAALKKDATKSEVTETSNGTEISRIVSGTLVLYAAPLDGSNVAVGLRAEPVRALIDQTKNKTGSVKEDETYKYLSGAVPADRVGSFYLNLTEIYKQVETVAPGQLSKSGITSMSGAFLMTVSGKDDGMQIDLASQADIKSSLTNQVTSTSKPDASTFNDIPSDAIAFYSGTDLKTIIKAFLDGMKSQPSGQDQIAQIETQVQQMTGMSLQNDIIPLLGGDFALSASGGGNQSMPLSSVVFQMKLNGGDRDKAAAAVDKVMQAVSQGQATSFDAAGGKFYDFSNMGMAGMVAGVGSDRLMVVWNPNGDGKGTLTTVSGNLGKGFGSTDKWNAAKKNLPADSNAILYVDLSQIQTMFGSAIPTEAQPVLKPFKYIIMGSAVQAAPGSSTPNRGLSRIFIGISK